MEHQEHNYKVIIKKSGVGKNTEITGTLLISQYITAYPTQSFNFEEIPFNPLIILGDLRNHELQNTYKDIRISVFRPEPKLIDNYNFEYGFGKPIYIGNDEQYRKFVSYLDRIMLMHECNTLDDLDNLRIKHDIQLDCLVSIVAPNSFYNSLQNKNRYAESYRFSSLNYEFGKANHELLDETYLKKEHQFYYHCHTMAEVIFAILHFLVIHKYEFKTCALCQNRYAKIPNNGLGKFCSRKSPLGLNEYFDHNMNKKFKDLSCQESMSKFHEIMRNRKKNKVRYIQKTNDDKPFYDEFDRLNDIIKESPVINNLINLYSFVNQYKINT